MTHQIRNYHATGTHDDILGQADEQTYRRYLEQIDGDDVGAVDGADYGYPGYTVYIED